MELFNIGFLTVRAIDLFDIAVVTFLFYKLYELLRLTYKDNQQIDPDNVMFIHRNLTLFVNEPFTNEEERIQEEMDILREIEPERLQEAFYDHFKDKEGGFFWRFTQILFKLSRPH